MRNRKRGAAHVDDAHVDDAHVDDAEVGNVSVRVMDGLRRAVRALGSSTRAVAQGGDVSGAQLFVLRQLAAAPGLSVGELAARTFARQSTVSEVVARLVTGGLVAREASATDARQVRLTVTARGRRVVTSSEPTAQERLARGLDALSAAQREALADGLDAWLAAAGLSDTPTTMFFEDVSDRRPNTALDTPPRAPDVR